MKRTTGPEPEIQLVAVFRTDRLAVAAFAKSLLEAEGIEHVVQGEEVRNILSGWVDPGLHGNPMPFHVAVFLVKEDDAERASQLLADVTDAGD